MREIYRLADLFFAGDFHQTVVKSKQIINNLKSNESLDITDIYGLNKYYMPSTYIFHSLPKNDLEELRIYIVKKFGKKNPSLILASKYFMLGVSKGEDEDLSTVTDPKKIVWWIV